MQKREGRHELRDSQVFAKTRAAARSLAEQFRERQLSKVYIATLLCGTHGGPTDSFEVDAKVARHPTNSLLSSVAAPEEEEALKAQVALTHFAVWARASDDAAGGPRGALCEVRPVSGRMHQIRLHAEHVASRVDADLPKARLECQARHAQPRGGDGGRVEMRRQPYLSPSISPAGIPLSPSILPGVALLPPVSQAGWPVAGDTQYGDAAQPVPQCGRLLLHAHSLQARGSALQPSFG